MYMIRTCRGLFGALSCGCPCVFSVDIIIVCVGVFFWLPLHGFVFGLGGAEPTIFCFLAVLCCSPYVKAPHGEGYDILYMQTAVMAR